MSNLTKLKQEQTRLQTELQKRENRLEELSDELEANFGKMALNSIMPRSSSSNSSITQIFQFASELFSSLLSGKIAGSSFGFSKIIQVVMSGIVWKYLKKAFR